MKNAAKAQREQLAILLKQSGEGDRQAFAELYRRTSGTLHGICLRMLHDHGVAEEILQDAYINVWKRADRFDPARASAMTWLVTLARNKAIDHLRKHHEVVLNDPEHINERRDEAPSPLDATQTSEAHQRLAQCLDNLETRSRGLVREAFFGGTTYKQLAAQSDVPLGTMKSWIRRSLIRLRTCLEHQTQA